MNRAQEYGYTLLTAVNRSTRELDNYGWRIVVAGSGRTSSATPPRPWRHNDGPGQLCGGILTHHPSILMFKYVTVEHEGEVGGRRLREGHKKFGRLV